MVCPLNKIVLKGFFPPLCLRVVALGSGSGPCVELSFMHAELVFAFQSEIGILDIIVFDVEFPEEFPGERELVLLAFINYINDGLDYFSNNVFYSPFPVPMFYITFGLVQSCLGTNVLTSDFLFP